MISVASSLQEKASNACSKRRDTLPDDVMGSFACSLNGCDGLHIKTC